MKSAFRILFVMTVFLVPIGINADVTIKRMDRSGGFKGFGAFEGTSEYSLQGLKRSEKTDMKYASKLMQMAAGKGAKENIIRVDKGIVWALSPQKKTYSETPIAPPPQKGTPPPKVEKEEPSPADKKPTHRIKRTAMSLEKTGDKKKINDFNCEHTKFTLLVEVEEIATGEVATFNLLGNFWMTALTAKLKQAQVEEMRFSKAYLEKLGISLSPDEKKSFDDSSVAMLLGVGGEKTRDTLASLQKKLSTLQGYPIVTETIWSVQADPKAVAREKQSKDKARAENNSAPELSVDPKKMAGNLMGAFAKKKMQAHEDKKDKERENKPLLSTYSEVRLIDLKPVSSDLFEIPAGYKKIK